MNKDYHHKLDEIVRLISIALAVRQRSYKGVGRPANEAVIEVQLLKDDLREITGRDTVRTVLMEDCVSYFQSKKLEAKIFKDMIRIRTIPSVPNHLSLKDLVKYSAKPKRAA